MRRQKRDKTNRAYARGYNVGIHGKSKELCPHHNLDIRQSWLCGWRNGRGDNWDGFTGVAGVGRAPFD
ncbi:MAG: ribosome modulation factor [Pseudomonadales bacterium]|nr:ribosome modulation factor [Pseudomonadales bacterium]